ncbi:MOSC domain-containing protein [Rhizomonospora bruguierae]|uniref:MOSC domain-containing protein n=1 Tax=Rhizomonospora bruguierae TaxID=1581705 RepID=UPI001BCA70ED|nr:MOSC domain-containing protein [Micromonospora sp. NBRC 107566]
MRLTTIRVHPMKSGGAVELDRVVVHRWGLAGDRRWAVMSPEGVQISGRHFPPVLGVRPRPLPDGGLLLTAAGHPDLAVSPPDPAGAPRVDAGRLGTILVAGEPAARWLTAVLGRPARLAWQPDPTERPIPAGHGGRPGDVTSLADDAPLLLVSQSSMDLLNEWVAAEAVERGEEPAAPLVIGRFRPNVVIGGGEPFAEDGWKRLRIGGVEFHLTEACDRCVLTVIDPETLVLGKEPIRTLSRHRKWDGKTWFGVRIAPSTLDAGATAEIAVGDEVEILG